MITTAKAFVTSDQKPHATLEAAQEYELGLLAAGPVGTTAPEWVMLNKEKIVDILTTTSTSKVRARKVNGGTKKRKATTDPAAVNRELQDGKQ